MKLSRYATKNEDAYRLYGDSYDDKYRSEYAINIDKILNCPFYNRYSDKTQVFSLRNNDELTRRATHVQLVAWIATIIGTNLGLNTELIQAIALGHDIGHTPFGHAGEDYLDQIYYGYTKVMTDIPRRFFHNVHSVRALKEIANLNLALQVYDGILFHNGEKLSKDDVHVKGKIYKLRPCGNIICDKDGNYRKEKVRDKIIDPCNWEDYGKKLDRFLEACTKSKELSENHSASTLEGCVVRVSDMLAYLHRDQRDAIKASYWKKVDNAEGKFEFNEWIVRPQEVTDGKIESIEEFDITIYENDADDNEGNSSQKSAVDHETIRTLINDIIRCSGKDERGPFLGMTKGSFDSLNNIKKQNGRYMYLPIDEEIEPFIKPIFMSVYAQMREDFENWAFESPIFQHHINYPFTKCYKYWKKKDGVWKFKQEYKSKDGNRLIDEPVVDFIASRTEDYIVDLYGYLLKKPLPYTKNGTPVKRATHCYIKIKLPIEIEGGRKYEISDFVKCKLSWSKDLYDLIKDSYSLSYFSEERSVQLTRLKEALGENKPIMKYMNYLEELRERKIKEICGKKKKLDAIIKNIKEQDNGIELTSDTVKERIAIALFNDYKFIRKNKDNLIEQIAVITQLDKKTIDSIRKKHISE